MVSSDRRWQRWALEGAPLSLLAIVYFIDLFLPWTNGCAANFVVPYAGHSAVCLSSVNESGLGGSGYAAACLAIAVAVFEGLRVARLSLPISLAYRSLISVALTLGLLLFTVLDLIPRFGELVSQPSLMPFGGAFAWLALALALAIAGGGLVHWRIWQSWAPVGPAPPVAQSPDPHRCSSCGRRNAAGAAFCAYCGRPLGG